MTESDGNNDDAVAAYKSLLQTVCDNRPSGTRGRLAAALGTNRSFVSQLANPTYAMPIPVQHLETIFKVCHFSPVEKATFLDTFDRAHPGRRKPVNGSTQVRTVSFLVPDLGTMRLNKAIDDALAEYARQLVRLVTVLGK